MKLAFNELSFQPVGNNSHTLYQQVIDVLRNYKYISDEFGYDHIITPTELSTCEVLESCSFVQWFADLSPPQKNRIQPLLMRRPFSDESLGEEVEKADKYFYQNDDPEIPQQYCKGLATAHILGLPVISIGTDTVWKVDKIDFYQYDDQMSEATMVDAINLSSGGIDANDRAGNYRSIIEYSRDNCSLVLIECGIKSSDKKIKLSEHHGSDKLVALAKVMLKDEYTVSVINSLPHCSETSRFIRKCHPDGRVEITMHWEDAGYGMVFQTTGRNLRETEAIAQILRKNHDR